MFKKRICIREQTLKMVRSRSLLVSNPFEDFDGFFISVFKREA